jgi:hypothetical protein
MKQAAVSIAVAAKASKKSKFIACVSNYVSKLVKICENAYYFTKNETGGQTSETWNPSKWSNFASIIYGKSNAPIIPLDAVGQ